MSKETIKFPSIKDVPASEWEKLSQKKIYFGHQSVGFDIIDGIKDLMKENPQIKLNIIETYDPDEFKAGTLAHSRIGYNVDPKSKIDAFAFIMKAVKGTKCDIAFFKYCFVDFNKNTAAKKVFDDYKKTMDNMDKTYTKQRFLNMTTPLTTNQTGIKASIKKLIGRPVGGVDDNIKRNEYNEMLRKEYEGKEPLFDIAKIESTFPDGTRCSFTKDGKTYYSMVPEYTNDGAHLNELGRKKVAEQLLILLSELN